MVARTTHPNHRVFSTIDMAPSKGTMRAEVYMRLPLYPHPLAKIRPAYYFKSLY